MRRRSGAGFTLVEIMIALGLAASLSAAVLMLVRTQLVSFELNDQLTQAQQSARTGADFVEAMLRAACGGISTGSVTINVAGVTPFQTNCLTIFDGAGAASISGGTFDTTKLAPATAPDAVEIIYATGTITGATAPPTLTSSPSVPVTDTTGFAANDYVLVGDYKSAYLFQIQSITAGTAPAGTLVFKSLTGAPLAPTPAPNLAPTAPTAIPVMQANVISIFVEQRAAANSFQNMLVLDPDGRAGTGHTREQPIVEGIMDLQIALGIDGTVAGYSTGALDGLLTTVAAAVDDDEWVGNLPGETFTTMPALPWNPAGAQPQLKTLRATIVAATKNSYSPITTPSYYENRTSGYPLPAHGYYRFRPVRIEVAPRAWNLTE